jgi:hypothetical protein
MTIGKRNSVAGKIMPELGVCPCGTSRYYAAITPHLPVEMPNARRLTPRRFRRNSQLSASDVDYIALATVVWPHAADTTAPLDLTAFLGLLTYCAWRRQRERAQYSGCVAGRRVTGYRTEPRRTGRV